MPLVPSCRLQAPSAFLRGLLQDVTDRFSFPGGVIPLCRRAFIVALAVFEGIDAGARSKGTFGGKPKSAGDIDDVPPVLPNTPKHAAHPAIVQAFYEWDVSKLGHHDESDATEVRRENTWFDVLSRSLLVS